MEIDPSVDEIFRARIEESRGSHSHDSGSHHALHAWTRNGDHSVGPFLLIISREEKLGIKNLETTGSSPIHQLDASENASAAA